MIGYHVRLDKKVSRDNKLVFCTIGILLRKLQEYSMASSKGGQQKGQMNQMNEYLSSISCIIIDEVHERSVECDFLLVLIKQYLIFQQNNNLNRIKIILMSATLSVEEFINYFQPIKNLKISKFHIPGKTYPVDIFYLFDILKLIPPENKLKKIDEENKKLEKIKENYCGKGEHGEVQENMLESLYYHNEDFLQYKIPNKLLTNLLDFIMKNIFEKNEFSFSNQPGARKITSKQVKNQSILIFLPGMNEISEFKKWIFDKLAQWVNQMEIIVLHSSIPINEQRLIYKKFPGKMKIILSTNIAETSITIPDVFLVIDSGLHKDLQYSPEKQLNSLQSQFISVSSANQRAGRAGRVQHGFCFRLFDYFLFTSKFNQFDTPEILKISLHEIFLSVSIFLLASSSSKASSPSLPPSIPFSKVLLFFKNYIRPPSLDQIENSRKYLSDLQLISSSPLSLLNNNPADFSISITPLGFHIRFPFPFPHFHFYFLFLLLPFPSLLLSPLLLLLSPSPPLSFPSPLASFPPPHHTVPLLLFCFFPSLFSSLIGFPPSIPPRLSFPLFFQLLPSSPLPLSPFPFLYEFPFLPNYPLPFSSNFPTFSPSVSF